jgi:hypothetical protein
MRRLALVALLTLALAACSQEPQDDAPADPAPSAPSATDATPAAMVIPDDFPLSDGMVSEAYDEISISPQSVGMRALDFCGRKPLRGLALAAEASGNEYANTRDLMLFAETGPPAAVLADIRTAATACPADPTGPGSRLLTEVRDSSFGATAATVIHTFEQDGDVGIGAEIIEVVQIDRALLVTSAYAEWDPATNLDEGITEEAGRLEETVAAMSIFEDSSPGAARAPALAVTPTPIPDDFPLALRIAENESDGEQPVPDPDAEGVSKVKACGEQLWPLAPARVEDRLAVRATGPEYVDARELVSMRGARVAVRAVARIRTALAHCTKPVRGAVWTVHRAYTGYDSVTFTLTYTRGLGASVFQVLRVGKGVLITHVYGEGMLETSGPNIRRQTRLGRDLAAYMCVFARAGC